MLSRTWTELDHADQNDMSKQENRTRGSKQPKKISWHGKDMIDTHHKEKSP